MTQAVRQRQFVHCQRSTVKPAWMVRRICLLLSFCLFSCSWSNMCAHISCKIIQFQQWCDGIVIVFLFFIFKQVTEFLDHVRSSVLRTISQPVAERICARPEAPLLFTFTFCLIKYNEKNEITLIWMQCHLFIYPNGIYQNHAHLIRVWLALIHYDPKYMTGDYGHGFSCIFLFFLMNRCGKQGETHPHPLNPFLSDLVGQSNKQCYVGHCLSPL